MSEVDSRLDILRRALDRAEDYFYNKKDSAGVDHIAHIKNEFELLKNNIKNIIE